MPYYDPDQSSEHSSRGSGYNDGASEILGVEDKHRGGWRFPANGQGAPADSQGNYVYTSEPLAGPGVQGALDSAKSRSPSPKAPNIASLAGDDLENHASHQHPVNIPHHNLKRALSGNESNSDVKSDASRHFADNITNSLPVQPPTKKRRVILSDSKTISKAADKVDEVIENRKEIVAVLREQTAVLACLVCVLEAVSR
ncbi:hypothetical protein DEU56DRAFT_752825 [Suillus clintonianus]|uniref:uncharacterized protein n=1 Tax=Suillus clintonianus TaxID=1904413 RepID=UPI001B87C342|nr:uncharacterized protein DEU56DRAFT_752825 [Suillus clintonianus]KAG2149155.1 hypothetical protein DEU56DRAFT_752825 [Suillus clintonianus]